MIRVDRLTKKYGEFTAVDQLSFKVHKGEMLGFLGVNGAGKSTTINMLSTLLCPDGGNAKVCGYTLGEQNEEIRREIGIVYQQNCLDDMLSVNENLLCRGILHGASGKEAKKRLTELSEILNLGEILKKPYVKLSGGQKRRCEIAAALMHTPSLLFLDEPTTGLDPATRKDVWQTIEMLRKDTGMTVFLTTHYMDEAAAANRIIILEKGKICAVGTPFELKEKYAADTVKLYCDKMQAEKISEILIQQKIVFFTEEYGLCFHVKNTIDSLNVLHEMKEYFSGFEVVQGNMDDAFLNACKGKGGM